MSIRAQVSCLGQLVLNMEPSNENQDSRTSPEGIHRRQVLPEWGQGSELPTQFLVEGGAGLCLR